METVILVATNDEYIKAFGNIWWKCFTKYWPDCPYHVVFITQTYNPFTDQCVPRRTVYVTEKDQGWNENVTNALQYVIHYYNPKSILLLHEDYLIGPQRYSGLYNYNIDRCNKILETDYEVRTIGLVRKDPETDPYPGWPEMLGYHALGGGILPVDPGGISLWRTGLLEQHLDEVAAIIPESRRYGRNGVVEFSFYGAEWAKERNEIHLRCRRKHEYPDCLLYILFGVTLEQGRLKITDSKQLQLVENAVGQPLYSLPELAPYYNGEQFKL